MIKFFQVRLEGTNISIPADDEKPIIGFYTTRHVLAFTETEAIDIAKRLVGNNLKQDENINMFVQDLKLEVDEVFELERWKILKFWSRPKGHTFY